MLAASNGNAQMVERLVTAGVDMSLLNEVRSGFHPGFLFTRCCSSLCLLYVSFPLHSLQRGRTALSFACRAGHINMVKVLLAAGADIINVMDKVRLSDCVCCSG
jgi:ankyrin repeat protein